MSGGQVQFERFTGGTLGTVGESLTLLKTGAVDVCTFPITPFANDIPLHYCIPTPIRADSGEEAAEVGIYLAEHPETGPLLEEELREQNIKYLTPQAGTTYGFVSAIEFSSLADIEGKKVGTHDPRGTYTAAGLVEVKTDIPEMYESLSRGVVDLVFFSVAGMVALGLYEPAVCIRTDSNYPVNSGPHFVNLNVFEALPADIQEIFIDAAQAAFTYSVLLNAETEATNIQIMRNAGVDVASLLPEDQDFLTMENLSKRKEQTLEIAEAQGKLEEAELIWEVAEEYLGISVPLP
jgi:TRAP-type C4-dicarboxylate transport system substrate-binding protein